MKYSVKRITDREQIETCEKFMVDNYMWDSCREPKVYGWMGYLEGEGLFVKMVCEETNPKRVFKLHTDPVYQDSTMEAFLAFPEGEIGNDCMYTNFEINANGAMLANFGIGWNRQYISEEQYEMTGVHAQIEEDKWYWEVLFPESYLKEISDFDAVKEGKPFYCNFYKICESPEDLHFGSYSPIESETPNFHMPICFAQAVIEEQ